MTRRAAPVLLGVAAAGLLAASAAASCAPPAQRMCGAAADCAGGASCVAGRCVARGAIPAIDSARRLVYDPVDVACVGRDDPPGPHEARTVAVLGGSGETRVLLRFDLSQLRPEEVVVEAFLAMERVPDLPAYSGTVTLHVSRVLDRWEGTDVSWANQPRLQEAGLPRTPVFPFGGPRVRLDVRVLLDAWRRRERGDLSLAVLADDAAGPGLALALAPDRVRGPELELYVR